MGVVYKKSLSANCMLGIWKIEEDLETLRSMVELDPIQIEILEGFKSHNRKIEWLSVRALLQNLIKRHVRILYNGDRSPYLEDMSHQISISHTKEMTSILISKDKKVGIDLEHMTHRIGSIAHKFINENEKVTDDPDKRTHHLYVHWCAKEALFKICESNKLIFREHLTVLPFDPDLEGSFLANVDLEGHLEQFRLNYFRIDDYSIVWCCK